MPAIHFQSTITRTIIFFSLLMSGSLLYSCDSDSGKSFKPPIPGYDESKRKVFVLDGELLEISGQTPLSNNMFAGINDEDGHMFIFHPNSSNIQTIPFSDEGDYEDIVKTDSAFYILEADGDLHEVLVNEGQLHNLKLTSGQLVPSKKYQFDLAKKVEFEAIVYYSSINKIILITKDHALADDAIFAYSFDLHTRRFDPEPFFEIPMRSVLTKLKDYSAQCKPSSAAIHPITGKLYILASIGKCILVCTPDGKVEFAYDLNPDQFQQPEGISFASNGDMYISNEGLQGKATMLLFPYQPGSVAK